MHIRHAILHKSSLSEVVQAVKKCNREYFHGARMDGTHTFQTRVDASLGKDEAVENINHWGPTVMQESTERKKKEGGGVTRVICTSYISDRHLNREKWGGKNNVNRWLLWTTWEDQRKEGKGGKALMLRIRVSSVSLSPWPSPEPRDKVEKKKWKGDYNEQRGKDSTEGEREGRRWCYKGHLFLYSLDRYLNREKWGGKKKKKRKKVLIVNNGGRTAQRGKGRKGAVTRVILYPWTVMRTERNEVKTK